MVDAWKMAIYRALPVRLQEAALGVYARSLDTLYYGDGFDEWREQFKRWQNRSSAEVLEQQNQQLRQIVQLAANRVPFYRQRWRTADWRGVRSAGDLHRLPRLEKQSLRQNEGEFIVEGLDPSHLWMEKTSGTTGTALRIYWPISMLPRWWALVEVTVRNVAGVGQDVPRAMMGGRPIVRGDAHRPPYWRFNRHWRQLYLSSYHVSRKSASGYVEALRRYGSQWITGYGSAIAALAESALELDLPRAPLRAAVVSGDTLLPGMRASIESFFACKCFDSYGQCEGVCMAMECPADRMHTIPAAGIWEILREDGSPCEPGEVGEIVATGLLNDAMPLIRYRTADYAAWSREERCPCGNSAPMITSLEGRVDDYLIAADGRKIGRLSTAMKRSPTIHSAQIVQDRPAHAYLLVRPGEGYQDQHGRAVRADITERIGAFDLDIVEVPEIPKTPQGKTTLVVRLSDQPKAQEIYEKLFAKVRYLRNLRAALAQPAARFGAARQAPLDGAKVLVMTTGHEATDVRIYAKQAYSLRSLGAAVSVVGKLENDRPGAVPVVKVSKASSRLARFFWQPWRCLWAARRLPADIIHFHDAEMLVALPLAKLWWPRSKFVYDVHEDFANLLLVRDWLPNWIKPLARLVVNTIEKTLASLADGVVAVTPALADRFCHRHKTVAYNFVTREFFAQAGKIRPEKREIDLIHVGTLSARRALFLVDVLREFHRLQPSARSLVVGVAPSVERLMEARLPKQTRLIARAAHNEIAVLLGNSKVGLDIHPWRNPHLAVALPVKICEYMAAGCAAVSSALPVLRQILAAAGAQADDLTLIDEGEPDDYALAAARTLESIAQGADPGAKLREIAARNLAWDGEAEKITQLYLRLLGRPCVI